MRQMLSRESEQPSAEVLALIFRGDEQLVEIEFGQMQRQHRRKLPVVVGDKEAPASLYLERNARATSPAGNCLPLRDRSKPSCPSRRGRFRHIRRCGRDGSLVAAFKLSPTAASPYLAQGRSPRDNIAGAFSPQPNAEDHSAAIRRGRNGRGSSPWSTP